MVSTLKRSERRVKSAAVRVEFHSCKCFVRVDPLELDVFMRIELDVRSKLPERLAAEDRLVKDAPFLLELEVIAHRDRSALEREAGFLLAFPAGRLQGILPLFDASGDRLPEAAAGGIELQ